MMLFLPIFLILLAAIFVKGALPFIFNLFGYRFGGALVLEERLGPTLFLICSAVMAGIAFWYPMYLITYHSAPDDRYGMALLFAFPFYFLSAGIAGMAFYRLLKAISKRPRNMANGIYAACGVLLALVGFSPLLGIAWRILTIASKD